MLVLDLCGGFPEYLKENEQEVLKRIFDDIVYRDLIVRFGIRNVVGFKNMTQYIFTNFTSKTGYLALAKLLGFNSATSIKEYLNILCEGYPLLIQVCFDMQNPKTRNREINSLAACMKELKVVQGIILTKNDEEVCNINNTTITIMPAWKWLLHSQPPNEF